MQSWVNSVWYGRGLNAAVFGTLLSPLSWLFRSVAGNRRKKQEHTQAELPVPVIIVGNISVGGTGKTPFTLALVQYLQSKGIKVGVVSRGYGGQADYPYHLDSQSTPEKCGDEPLLIYQRCQCPVVVDPNRVNAIQHLLNIEAVDVIVSDDGLQHYRMPRALEIAVVDGSRGLGNGKCLPAGPLREPPERLAEVDWVIVNGANSFGIAAERAYEMHLQPGEFLPVGQTKGEPPAPNAEVHALAGIGNPQRFFDTLTHMGYMPETHSFADHYQYKAEDLNLTPPHPVLMTEKDAVKCTAFGHLNRHWYLPVNAELPAAFWQELDQGIQKILA